MIVVSIAAGGLLTWLFGFSVLIAAMMVGGSLVNEVHAWAHRPSTAPRWARVLQETGFIQSPKHHAGHHRPPQDKHYCILTDWLDPVLDALDAWGRAERGLARFGFEPHRGTR
jgi:ubiquitin-conjugating enzyme E2 variant